MKLIVLILLSQSILFPLIAGLIRLRRIDKSYQPFYILLVVGFVNELISEYIIKFIHISNAPASNIYSLIEWLLILWLFQVWGSLRTWKKIYFALVLLSCTIWVTENLIFGHFRDFSPYFRIFSAFLIVLLSVNKINFMITHDNHSLLRQPRFLICIGFIIYFIYKIIFEWAYQTSLFGVTDITTTIIFLEAYINALTNVIFAIALLMIPAPEKFTLR